MKRYIMASEDDMLIDDNFHPNPAIRLRRARAANSPELLEVFAYDPDVHVRYEVASNPNTPGTVLFDMAKFEVDQINSTGGLGDAILAKIAAHRNTTKECLEYLFGNTASTPVRLELADREDTPPDILASLAEDTALTWRIRAIVAGNPNTPTDILYSLAEDDAKTVRYLAKQELKHRGETL